MTRACSSRASMQSTARIGCAKNYVVMPGLGPGNHAIRAAKIKTWMAGTSPAMTLESASTQSENALGYRHGTGICIAASQFFPSKVFGTIAERSIPSRQRTLTSILSGSERGT